MKTLPIIANPKIVNVFSSRAAISAKGRAGLVFQTGEVGTILFPVNLSAIQRASLTEIEEYLIHSKPGKAN
jgi:hypothetical protein